MRGIRKILPVALILAWPAVALAFPVYEWEFSGHITQTEKWGAVENIPSLSVGDAFSGFMFYEYEQNRQPVVPELSWTYEVPSQYRLDFGGGLTLEPFRDPTYLEMYFGGEGRLRIVDRVPLSSAGWTDEVYFSFTDLDNAFHADPFQFPLLDFTIFEEKTIFFELFRTNYGAVGPGEWSGTFWGTIDSIQPSPSPVPEPSTLTLIGLGIFGAVMGRRKQRPAQ